ncbi:protein RNA-directed DNA methylation 3 isoform X2 [Lotus japonicus]|uniref:protein RNA-directed DNA methylation 3 isoform X2 n=1 Tax=Lotus japonicus TaxID=34305 RepID=UPI002585931D|nr:protein RNA-directed DNA methylation 3 isoform X2 [Lotus japonicus]
MTNKGKQVAGKDSAGKRKANFDDDKTGGGGKRKNRGVVQFFEEAAAVDDYDTDNDTDDSNFDDLFGDEYETLSTMLNDTNASAKSQSRPAFVPKEEVVDEEFDRFLEERYAGGSKFSHFADEYDDKPMDPSSMHPGAKEVTPAIWKVKCTVGRERLSAFCLMQKFADMKKLGTNLKLISAFSVDHMKGFVYMEADKQCDINEACKGLTGIYVTRVQPVPPNEVYHLFSVRKKSPDISEGMWARIKSGNYKGDLAQVAAVSKKTTVKLIPRVDLQALAAKFGGGNSRQKTAIAAPRLISSSELDEFRPLIQLKRDRDTGKVFEVLDGMMFKDGFVYKKVSPDSLSLWGVVPTEEELLKFGTSENNESTDLEWLSQLYGDSKKKRVVRGADKGGEKGEGTSSSSVVNGFELNDLVCFGKKDFGVIVSMDKEDCYKILKEGSDGPVAVTLERHQIKSGLFDLKLTAQDRHSKTILVNDNVRVLEGPSKDKQGIVKHIYRGIVFLYNEIEEENCGYFTAKSSVCEKVKHGVADCIGKDGEPGPLIFEDPLEDPPTSPRSPLSLKKPWQARENNREFNRGDQDSLFAIGQTLRIRIGPLKGYLCRVIAIRRSDVTVKLDSQQKVLTVKSEHLSEVQGKSTAVSASVDPDSSSLKPFDLLGTEGSSGGWMNGVGASTGGGGWNAGGTSAGESTGGGGWNAGGTSAGESTGGGGWNVGGTSAGESTGGGGWNAGGTSAGESTGGGGWNTGGTSAGESTGGGGWNAGGTSAGESTGGGGWNVGGTSAGESTGGGGWNVGGTSTERSAWPDSSAPSLLKPESTANPFGSEGTEDTAWATKSTSNQKSSWGAAVENNRVTSDPVDSGGSKKGGGSWGQAENRSGSMDVGNQNCAWKNKTSDLDGNQSSQWNTTKASEEESPGWSSAKKSNDSPATGWGQGSGVKSGSDGGANLSSAWGGSKSGTSNTDVGAGWNNKPNKDGNKASGWGQAGHKSGGMDADNQNSTWKNKANDLDGNQSSGWNATKASEEESPGWGSVKKSNDRPAPGWGQSSGSKSGADDNQNSTWKSKTNDFDGKQSSGWNATKASEEESPGWNSAKKSNDNPSTGWGKNGGGGWGQAGEKSGSMDVDNQNSSWKGGSSFEQNPESQWGSGSGNTDDGAGRGNWRGGRGTGDSDRGGFRGRGFRGRGERGGFGGRGERGGFGGRGDRGGFGGRGRSDTEDSGGRWGSDRGFGGRGDRGGFGGRGRSDTEDSGGRWGSDRGFGGRGDRGGFGGRGRSDSDDSGGRWGSDRGRGRGRGRGRFDQSGGWSNRQDSGEDGSSDWKKGADSVEGGKNNNGSGSWNQDSGGKKGWSQGNADERPSWSQGGGSNKPWQGGSSAGAGASGGGWKGNDDKKDGQSWTQGNAGNDRPSWNQGGGSNKPWQGGSSAGAGASGGGWKGNDDKKDGPSWSQGNAGNDRPSWNQGGGSNNNTQGDGWNKGSSSSNTTSGGWNQSSAADMGQSTNLNESADGSWGKKNDGGNKGGWG